VAGRRRHWECRRQNSTPRAGFRSLP
jgi:hypothetical protein